MRVLSLFDGMACGYEALKRAGIAVTEYHAFEIDKYAIQIAKKNHPDIIHHGNVIDADFYQARGKIDMIIGGSPCQGFSFAGKQLAFDDPRSALFSEYVRAIKDIKPKWFLLENVPMKQEYLNVISDSLGVQPILINSALVSAQNRKRYYWCNWYVDQPFDKGIVWGDIKETNVDLDSFYYTEKAMQWLARHSRKNNKLLKIHDDSDKMQMIEASHHKKYSSQRFLGIIDYPKSEESIAAIRGRYNEDRSIAQWIEFRRDNKSNSLTTVSKDNVVVPFTLPHKIPVEDFFFRYITPIECERLQTLPDNYTEGVSNTQRYRMLGNGWTIDVISHILEQWKM
jgi:DNA-cytosine methyltransferase